MRSCPGKGVRSPCGAAPGLDARNHKRIANTLFLAGGRLLRQRQIFQGELLLLQPASKTLLVRYATPQVEIAFATINGNEAGAEPGTYPRGSAR